ncbi:MAG TPA: 50S ribosomal protein L11 methyltransferase [Bacillota bacterium]|nr:50S ribosomal protein L11 methyltransferase [Bacillota bacterium]HPX69939.1 50S ribosomal protein L11 methyltransferase [Bacillota bacterium]HQA65962.1 50S ribosomal protein L11 methyltransferase [Bacillota bacterium]HQO42881.1 50S ribosomal protein L11 methyltransferase [Bacillota bacterium]HQQ44502.1 50S ribosomal protein L11 methyltransferase [Bacillota bacterium]
MKYVELQVITTTEASDAVSEILYSEGASGVLIEDPNDFNALNKNEKSWDYIEDELIELMGKDARVKGYFPFVEFNETVLKSIADRIEKLKGFGLNKGKGTVSTREVSDEDWANAWKKYYKPVKIGERVVIKPTWEEHKVKADEVVIELDPGMAFGTGTHETTIMCVKLLEKYIKSGSTVFDVGCGSGILGIAAAKLGAEKVVCVDIDEVSCRVSRENAEINKVDERVDVRCGNLLNVVSGKADVIIANIIADIIISFSEDAMSFLAKGGIFISSGIISDRRDEVLRKLRAEDFSILEVLEMGEWCAIAAEGK